MSDKKTKNVKVTVSNSDTMMLSSVALNQIEQAKLEQAGHKFRWILPSMAFSTFSVEALCNLYGQELFKKHWKHFESSSFLGKVIMISEFLEIEVDFSKEPWQTINEMKDFRNELVHAKPSKSTEIYENIPAERPNSFLLLPKTKSIADKISIKKAEKFVNVYSELQMLWIHATDRKHDRIISPMKIDYEES